MPPAKEDLDLDTIVDHGDDVDDKDADRGDALVVDDDAPAEDKKAPAGGKDPADDIVDDPADDKAPDDKAPDEKADPEPDDKRDVPNPMVPRSRLTESQKKRREAEARAAELESELQKLRDDGGQSKAFKAFTEKVDKLYEDVEVARAEGDYKKAATIQRELDQMRDGANRASVEYLTKQQAAQAQDLAAYEAVVDQVELLVPELNPEADEFDPDVLADVSATRDGYEAHGMKPAAALKKAMKLVLGRDVFTQAKDLRTKEAPIEKKKTDVKKNIEAAKKQPPDTDDSAPSEKTKTMDVSKLSDDEFDKLPEAVRRRLRGDFV